MKRIAIVISSQSSQTKKIADSIVKQLFRFQIKADVLMVEFDQAISDSNLAKYDAAIIGCPVYLGDFPQMLIDWTWENREILNSMPTGFFTENLNAADPRSKARAVDNKLLKSFMQQTEFRPRFVASFAGALEYTQYSFFKRCVLQGISAAAGGPTDTSRDFELTDWAEVEEFAEAFKDQNMRSEYATFNRLPNVPDPFFPIGVPRVA